MKILIGKVFGLGNAVQSIPMIKAIKKLYPYANVDLLVGNSPDDGGAWDVFCRFKKDFGFIDKLFVNFTDLSINYELAIMAMPFDGRWQQGIHFNSMKVMDGVSRPDPTTMGFSSWKKHEIEYQMDNAIQLGYSDVQPSMSFYLPSHKQSNAVYIGVGYKKDVAGFWKKKHWGNQNYADLIKMLLVSDRSLKVYLTGDTGDMIHSMAPIMKLLPGEKRIKIDVCGLEKSFETISKCHTYIGNDTGMMHVAASMNKDVIGLFFMENITKNRPWCDHSIAVDGTIRQINPIEIFELYEEMRDAS